MAGKLWPSCGQLTFFEIVNGWQCFKCRHKIIIPVNEGKGGKGQNVSTVASLLYLTTNASLAVPVTNKRLER